MTDQLLVRRLAQVLREAHDAVPPPSPCTIDAVLADARRASRRPPQMLTAVGAGAATAAAAVALTVAIPPTGTTQSPPNTPVPAPLAGVGTTVGDLTECWRWQARRHPC